MVCPAIGNPVSCKIRAVIHFDHAKNMSAVETHCQLCVVYSQTVMTEGIIGQSKPVDGPTNVNSEERNGWLAICSER
jgi:hypothetical protein